MSDLWNWNRNIPDFNTFIIIGTVNSLYGNLSHDLRFQHTVEAIDSVHRKAPGSKILYVDNSSIPLKQEWVDIITPKVDLYVSHMIVKSETTKVSFSIKHFCYVQMSLKTVPFLKFF